MKYIFECDLNPNDFALLENYATNTDFSYNSVLNALNDSLFGKLFRNF